MSDFHGRRLTPEAEADYAAYVADGGTMSRFQWMMDRDGVVNVLGPAPSEADLAEARRQYLREITERGTMAPPRPGTTVFIVADFGTIELLQATLDGLPMGTTCVVEPMITFPQNTTARVVVTSGDPGFVKFAMERQGYARILRIAESHGPNTAEIPVTPKET